MTGKSKETDVQKIVVYSGGSAGAIYGIRLSKMKDMK